MGNQLNVLIVPPVIAVKAAWLLEVRIAEKSKLIWINKVTLWAFARFKGHDRDRCNFERQLSGYKIVGFPNHKYPSG
jgi:hypothetical protein